jgi:hypothetical protein
MMLVEELNHRFTAIGYCLCEALLFEDGCVRWLSEDRKRESARAEQQPLPNMRSTLRPFFWRSGKEIRAGELGGQGRKPSSRTKIPSADTSQHLCGISNQEQ